MTEDLGKIVVRLTARDGSTVLLELATNGPAIFSTDGGELWNYLLTNGDTDSENDGSYTFTGGIVEHDGIVYLDNTKVAMLLDRKLDIATLPKEVPLLVGDKLDVRQLPASVPLLDREGKLDSDVLPEEVPLLVEGKIPDKLLPTAPEQLVYTAGPGISIDPNTHVISEAWGDYR